MPAKVPKATKDLAYRKLRDGLGNQEVADLTGLSLRSVGRMKALLNGTAAMPARSARTGQDTPQNVNEDERTTLDFEDSPAPIEKKNVVDEAWASLKGMLGISSDKNEKPQAPLISAKLNAKQQQFVDAATPTIALAFMAMATYMWSKITPEYSDMLAPDEEVAQRIVTPLIRIYARHANFLTDVHPDVADMGASLFALVGYVHVSYKLFRQIKQEEWEANNGQDANSTNTYRRATTTPSENGAGDAWHRRDDVQRGRRRGPAPNGSDGGTPENVGQPALTGKEAEQYAALSRLSQLDFEHRARRSGRSA